MPWTILVVASLLGFSMWAPLYCIPPMEHILKAELNLTYAQTSLLYIGPPLMLAAMAIPGGLLGDRIGARKAAGIGAIIIAVGTLLRSTSTNPTSILAYTFIYGIGIGWVFPNLAKLVSGWVPYQKAGIATGIYSVGIMAGVAIPFAVTMPLLYPITDTFQGVFLLWSIPAIVAAIAWWIIVKEPPREYKANEPLTVGSHFSRVARNKQIWLVAIIFLLHNFFFYTWTGWAPLLLMMKGATATSAGLITSIFPWVGIPTVILMPRLAYKLHVRKPFLWVPAIVMALAAAGATHMNLTLSWLVMALVGIANNTRFTTVIALPVEMVAPEDTGTASGLILSIGHLGAVGAWVGGHTLDTTSGLDIAMLILVGISAAAAGLVFKVTDTGRRTSEYNMR